MYKRIFFSDRIEYRILFVQAKSTESNIEYYSFCKKYSNNIRIVQNIRIFEYFWIILKDKIKKLKNNNSQKYFSWNLKTGHQGVEKNWILTIEIFVKLSFHVKKWNRNFQNLWISSDFRRQIFGNIRAKYSNIRIIFSFWKLHQIEYEYQYSEENIRIFEYIRIFVYTLIYNPIFSIGKFRKNI